MTRRLAVLVPAVLALLLGAGLWAAPRFIDWESWRTQIADVAAARLGRPVSLEGPIALVLLPNPRVEAGAVTVGDAGDGVTVGARAMRLRLDLPALLAGGRLEPREIVLVGGEIRMPWPPGALPSFRPPSWLTAFDARLEDCRLLLGGLELEKFNARLATGGAAEALVTEGSFAWRGQAVRFSGQLGRAGFDGIAPLDLGLAAAGATLSARGVLLPAGGFEGRMDAAGVDLSALVPAPAVPFRAATTRFTAAADLLAADGLSLDLGGQPARGAVTLRLDPALRLDVALSASRLDLDAWVAALRAAMGRAGASAARALPVSVDLSAEATSLAGVPLRRLRGGAFLQGERLTLSDVSAVLPGDTAVELAGATAGPRLEAALRFAGSDLRATLEALGAPLAGTDPARLRAGEGRFRLALQGGEAAFSDLVATVDGAKVTGAGVLRPGPRPSVGLGLFFDKLDLDGLLPDVSEWPAAGGRAAANLDLNLRLAAERVSWRGAAAERASLDATAEAGRLALRRLAFRLGEVDAVASGNAAFGGGQAATRLSDISVELSGADGKALGALLPAGAAELLPLDGHAVALRLSGNGPPEALNLRAEGEAGDLRAEAAGTVDAAQRRVAGATLTARHPGAPRLLAPLLGDTAAAGWLGQGSFSLVATGGGDARAVNADSFDLVAGELRLRGNGVSVFLGGPRPRVTGRLAAERLPLPGLAAKGDGPLGLRNLTELDAEVAVEAARVEAPGLPPLEAASAALALSAGTLRLDNAQARLGGGALRGALAVEGAAEPPRMALDAALSGTAVSGPLFGGLPVDLAAGKADAKAELAASGHSAAAMLATLGGTLAFGVRGGILNGYDLGAVQAASALPDLGEAEAALRRALAGGATEFERLEGTARFADGRATLEGAVLSTEGGAVASATGGVDVGRGGALDLRLATRPVAEAPEIGLRVSGPAADPRRQPELAPFLRWRAEQ